MYVERAFSQKELCKYGIRLTNPAFALPRTRCPRRRVDLRLQALGESVYVEVRKFWLLDDIGLSAANTDPWSPIQASRLV